MTEDAGGIFEAWLGPVIQKQVDPRVARFLYYCTSHRVFVAIGVTGGVSTEHARIR